jgi:hypothetical protein
MSDKPSTPTDNPPVEDGKSYRSKDPYGTDIVLFTFKTWTDIGADMESLRQIARNQDKRIKELLKQNADLKTVNDDLAERLDNLRRNHRLLVAKGVQQQLDDLDLVGYTSPPNT